MSSDQAYYYARLSGIVKNPKEFSDKFNKKDVKLDNFRTDNEILKKKLIKCQEELKEARIALGSIARNDLVVPLCTMSNEIDHIPSAPPPPYSEIAFSD